MFNDAMFIKEQYKLKLDEIIPNEELWAKQNLQILYNFNNVLGVKIRHNPYIEIRNYGNGDNLEQVLFLPKYLATQSLELYFAVLKGVDRFITSIVEYANPITGEELLELLYSTNDNNNMETLKFRMNIVFRKFLSYQYLIINK